MSACSCRKSLVHHDSFIIEGSFLVKLRSLSEIKETFIFFAYFPCHLCFIFQIVSLLCARPVIGKMCHEYSDWILRFWDWAKLTPSNLMYMAQHVWINFWLVLRLRFLFISLGLFRSHVLLLLGLALFSDKSVDDQLISPCSIYSWYSKKVMRIKETINKDTLPRCNTQFSPSTRWNLNWPVRIHQAEKTLLSYIHLAWISAASSSR